MKGEISKGCGFGAEMVAYLYGEAGEAEARKVEDHLKACGVCAAEFAAVSHARTAVTEWRDVAFAPLETPRVNIPYMAAPVTEPGFSARLAALFSHLFARPAYSVAAVAVLITMAAVATISLRDQSSGVPSSEVAAVGEPAARVEVPSLPVPAATERLTAEKPPLPAPGEAGPAAPAVTKARTARASTPVRANPRRTPELRDATARRAVAPVSKPVLDGFQEMDDTSLRLADLFDDIGG